VVKNCIKENISERRKVEYARRTQHTTISNGYECAALMTNCRSLVRPNAAYDHFETKV